jgi:hypothetical protein
MWFNEGWAGLALDSFGLDGAQLDVLADFFRLWLHGEAQPTIPPKSFGWNDEPRSERARSTRDA